MHSGGSLLSRVSSPGIISYQQVVTDSDSWKVGRCSCLRLIPRPGNDHLPCVLLEGNGGRVTQALGGTSLSVQGHTLQTLLGTLYSFR